ncbi:MAG: AAA family ATPase [Candidatus Hydrothermarchaeales archaeon]
MIITIGGDIGSGKSTVAKALAERFQLKHISAGDTFRAMANERGMSLADFSKLAEQDYEFDKELDDKQVALAREAGDAMVDGRLSGVLLKEAVLKMWLRAPIEERARRVVKREGKDYDQALQETKEREVSEVKRYLDIYDIDLRDLSIYDVVLNTGLWGPEEVINIIGEMISLLMKVGEIHGDR